MAKAQAKAMMEKAQADRDRLLSEAEGRAAIISAENAQSPELIARDPRGEAIKQAVAKALGKG